MESSVLFALLFVLCTVLVFAISSKPAALHHDSGSLPDVKSLIPGVGSGLDFGWNIPRFLRRCINTYGPNFRALIGSRPFYFVSSPEALDAFYRNRNHGLVAIRGIGKSALGGTESDRVDDIVNDTLIPIIGQGNQEPSILELMPTFTHRALRTLHDFDAAHKPITLTQLTSFVLFNSFTVAMWGDSFPVHTYADVVALDKVAYYLLSQINVFAWSTARMQARMRAAHIAFMRPWRETGGEEDMDGVSAHGNAVMRALVASGLSDADCAGLLQSYTWGIFTNVSRITLWLFLHLLHDRAAHAQLQAAIDAAVERELPTADALRNAHPNVVNGPAFRMVDSALKETFRIHSMPLSYRTVAKDVPFPGVDRGTFTASPGSYVVANTTAVHWDERIFPEPKRFRVDRFVEDENLAKHVYMYGRGAHMCSGRNMSNYIMKMLVILTLRYFDVVPADETRAFALPAENPRSTGLMRPTEEVRVLLKPRRKVDF